MAAVALVSSACGGSETSAPDRPLAPAAQRGRAVAADNGCGACHSTDGSRSTGPTWKGLAGSEVELEGGRRTTADVRYLAKAIAEPRADTVAGYANIMPRYPDLSPGQIDDLVDYLQALAE